MSVIINPSSGGGGGGMAIGGTVTSGTPGSVLFIGPLSVLAQDNANFFWDDTHFSLNIQGIPGLYRVANVSGDNWFEAGAGNFTVTGFSNFGTGGGALANVSTGQQNVAIGQFALNQLTTGEGNFAVGTQALFNNLDGSFNTAIGIQALDQLNNGGGGQGNNTALGFKAGLACTGASNIFLGFESGLAATSVAGNSFIGNEAGSALITGNSNNIIGNSSWANATSGTLNTFIGDQSGVNITGSNWCTVLGAWRGPSSSINSVIALTSGHTQNLELDYGYIHPQTWSMNYDFYQTSPVGLHIYNFQDTIPPTNYERAVLDWNTTSNVFTIGTPASSAGGTGTLRETRLYTKGLPAIFTVTNASGNNWFEGNAGNFTLTGSGNFGTGDTVLASLTTGSGNLAMGGIDASSPYGISTAASITTGGHAATGNVALGASALCQLQSGQGNVAVGARALEATVFDQLNVAIAPQAMPKLGAGGAGSGGNNGNVAIGNAAFGNLSTGTNMVAIGDSAAQNIVSSASGGDIFVGANAGNGLSSSAGFNTMIGNAAGFSITSGSNNTILGGWLGTATAISNVIAFSHGINHPSLDFNYTISNIWSFLQSTSPVGIHVYNTTDNGAPPTNFEKFCFDWTLTSNIARISMVAGGTGTVRLIAIDGFQKAGAPAAGDLPSGTWTVENDTSGGNTWLVYNNAGTIRKVQLV